MIRCRRSIRAIPGIRARRPATSTTCQGFGYRIAASDHEPRRRELEQGVLDRDAFTAPAAPAPKQQPREHGDVVASTDLRPARRAPRPRSDDGLALREPIHRDRHEAAHAEAERQGDDRADPGVVHRGRTLPACAAGGGGGRRRRSLVDVGDVLLEAGHAGDAGHEHGLVGHLEVVADRDVLRERPARRTSSCCSSSPGTACRTRRCV